jgi:hypothetical protein
MVKSQDQPPIDVDASRHDRAQPIRNAPRYESQFGASLVENMFISLVYHVAADVEAQEALLALLYKTKKPVVVSYLLQVGQDRLQ